MRIDCKPHFVIGDPANPYLLRWYLVPRNRRANIYLHNIRRSDDDRALHDHPWASVSILFRGQYIEHTDTGSRLYRAPAVIYRAATQRHRLELIDGQQAWTLFLTGRNVRTWGFWCPRGFVPWHEFVAPGAKGQIRRGCGEQ